MDGYFLFLSGTLLVGFNMFVSGMFTAFSNGVISVTLSLLRCLGFLATVLIVLPKLFGLTGFWLAWPVAEFLTLIVSVIFLILFRKRYHYM